MTKKREMPSDAMIEKMRELGAHVINIPDLRGLENLDSIDDVELFAQLCPLMTNIAELLGKPVPTHKDIKDTIKVVREYSNLQSAKEE